MPGYRLYRRSPTIVVSWDVGGALVTDYALNVSRRLPAGYFETIAALSGWSTAEDVSRRVQGTAPDAMNRTLEDLAGWGVVERSNDPVQDRRRALAASSWESWSPAAAFYHFTTQNGGRLSLEEAGRLFDRRLEEEDYPDVVKRSDDAIRVALPPFRTGGALARTLLSRRSWRQFGPGPVPLAQLATLLGLTWGVQQWMRVRPTVRVALKTSPSGGACHPLEVYAVVRRVRGLEPGIYHYCGDTHDLEVVRRGLADDAVTTLMGGQPWFAECAVLFVMTAVMPRVQWKYRFPQAYRTVLIEAGHFAQTFCLVATSLGLAPFSAAAMADCAIEEALGIDGVDETPLYVTGVGLKPEGVAWAPWPAPNAAPPVEAPAHTPRAARRRKGTR